MMQESLLKSEKSNDENVVIDEVIMQKCTHAHKKKLTYTN